MGRLGLALGLLACCFARPARADDSHYQNQLIGERALGLGGAFTAVSTDPTASYYNPGGLATTLSASISASLNLYGIEYRKVSDGFVSYITGDRATADLEATSYPTVPTTFGVLRTFGETFADGSRRHAVAFSMLIPDQSTISYSATIGRSGETDLDVFRLSESDRTLWAGPSYAIRVSDDLALGISAFMVMRNWSRSYSRALETPTTPPGELPTSDYFEFDRVDASLDTYELLFRIGALYRPLPNFSVGLTLGLPSIHIYGDAALSNEFSYAWFDPPPEYGDFRMDSVSGRSGQTFEPLEIRTGLAWVPTKDMLVALDVSYHMPTLSPYERVHLWQEDRARVWFDDLFDEQIDRRGVLNINVGWEWLVAESWPLRAGLFTNFSAAQALRPNQPGLERVDIYGVTLSVGYNFAAFAVNVGFLGSVGWGTAQAFNVAGDGPAFLERDAQYGCFYFFLSGAQRIVTETLEKWIKASAESAPTPPPEPPAAGATGPENAAEPEPEIAPGTGPPAAEAAPPADQG